MRDQLFGIPLQEALKGNAFQPPDSPMGPGTPADLREKDMATPPILVTGAVGCVGGSASRCTSLRS